MRLKIVTPEKQEVVVIEDDATLADLIKQLQDGGTTASSSIKIKSGFPPKLVDISDLSVTLGDVGIRPGDKLIVEQEKPAVTTSAVASTTDNTATKPTPDSRIPPSLTTSTPYVAMNDGYCVLRKIPDDNSCLFRSISSAVFRNLEEGSQLRSIVADAIKENPEKYNAAILGKPVKEYTQWIQKPNSWGGAIELQILSEYLKLTIHTLDVETGQVFIFNEGQETFIYLVYSGIHYDTVSFTMLADIDNTELDVSVFEDTSDLGLEFAAAVLELRKNLNHKGYVTNTNTFKVKCLICNAILDGDKAATKHAQSTMHFEFGEV